MTTPAGWYDDGSGRLRWWDGSAWTEHVAPMPPAAAAPDAAVGAPDAAAPATAAPDGAAPGSAGASAEPASAPTPEPASASTPEPETFVPPYAMPTSADARPADAYGGAPAQGYPPAHGYPPAAGQSPAPARRVSVLGLVGLGAALVGVVLACIPPIAIAGWVVLGLALVASLVSLFLPGAKWPGITGLGVAVLGAVLALAIALILTGFDRADDADDAPVVAPSEQPSADDEPADTEDPADIEGAEMIPVPDLEVGDCLPLVEDWEEVTYEVPVVPCDQPHTDEVYHVTELPDGDFPGEDALQAQADELCIREFETFVGTSYDESALDYYWYVPTKASWNRWDDRKIQCVVFSYEDVTGTLQGSGL